MAFANGLPTMQSASSCPSTVCAPERAPCLGNPLTPPIALGQLHRLKSGSERLNADALETVKWLDDITSMPAVETSGRVQLEGVDEAYATWAEVEHFLLPETLLSEDTTESEDDDYHEDLESSFNALDVSDGTSMSSTHSLEDAPKTPESPHSGISVGSTSATSAHITGSSLYATKANLENARPCNPKANGFVAESPNRTARNSAEIARSEKPKSPKSLVPTYLQPLFNHVLWRIHKEANPDAALESFILLTNDPMKQSIAGKFGIRAKRLEQLRDAVAREDREYRNRLTVYKMEADEQKPRVIGEKLADQKVPIRPKSSRSNHSRIEFDSDDEDEVLLKRAPRGPQAQAVNSQRVFDPNDFGRANPPHGPRGGRGGYTPRGRGSPRGGRGAFAPRGAYAPPGPSFRAPPAPRHDPNQPIDPDSFTRPVPRASPQRGARRKLWEPN